MAKEVVNVVGVDRRYGNNLAVSDVSFNVHENEIFALLGPNGSGKSTLLRMLCGFLQPSSGHISILGRSLLGEPRDAKSVIGYVPDQGGLYLHQSVRRFLEFVSGAKNIPVSECASRLDHVIEKLQLESVLDKKISTLSRGYRQRVSLAQALLNQPKLILMDEPTNGLDPMQIRQWRELMKSLKQSCTIVFTSHILDEVSALADRVGLLVNGKLVSVESLHPDSKNALLTLERAGLAHLEANAHTRIENVTELDETLIEVTVAISNSSLPDVIAELASQGVRLHGATRVGVNLEALFFHATNSDNLLESSSPTDSTGD